MSYTPSKNYEYTSEYEEIAQKWVVYVNRPDGTEAVRFKFATEPTPLAVEITFDNFLINEQQALINAQAAALEEAKKNLILEVYGGEINNLLGENA